MKVKNLFVAIACVTMGAMAVNAKDASELRIYINPGHGSWGGGDRNMGTIKHGEPKNEADTCGFFESNTDLWKCLGLVDRLEEYGLKLDRTKNQDNPVRALQGCARDLSNNIFMSRVKNGPVPGSDESDEAYNRSLTEICYEVQRNNFDMFFSLHSNAAGDEFVNYPALFVRGENKVAGVPGSDENAKIAWPFAFAQGHQNWSHYSMTNPNVIYDVDFWSGDYLITNIDGVDYKGYYGVLRHGVMGFMAEGYFHTYGPARHRAMNVDVCHDEGDAYARGIAEIFGLQRENNGTLYGIVRDAHERFRHKYYNTTAKSDDNFKPLNNVKVELLSGDKVVDTYTTDDEWNGAFVFDHLTPGEYSVHATIEGYKDAGVVGPFTVKAAETTYPDIWLENVNYVPEAAAPEDYADPVTTPAIKAADSYNMTAELTKEVAELDGKTIRRLIARGDNLYVLALDENQAPTLLILDKEFNVVEKLGTDACKGSNRALADIQFSSDGVLIGSSASITHYSDATIDTDFGDTERGSCNFYRWANNEQGIPSGQASVWFTTLASGNLYRGLTANTFVYTGTIDNGEFTFPTSSSYGAERMFFSHIEVLDGEVQSFTFDNSGKNTDYLCGQFLGKDYTFTLAPYDKDVFVVNAPGLASRAFRISDLEAAGEVNAELLDASVAANSFFKYAGHSYLAAPAAEAPVLIDVTEGVDNAKNVDIKLTAAGSHATAKHAAGVVSVTKDNNENVTDADISIFVADGKTITKYTTANVEQDAVAGVWAYGLTLTDESANTKKLNFTLTGDAKARVELVSEGKEPIVVAADSYAKGQNSVTVNTDEYNKSDEYNWQVVVENKAVPAVASLFSDAKSGSGFAYNNNTEHASFGTAYYASKTDRAIYIVSPDFTFSGPYANTGWDTSVGASPWRLAVLPSGKLLVTDWGDKHGGIYLFDPENPSTVSNFFAGTCNSASGEWTYEGTVIGGSTSGVSVRGTGEDTKLYTFQEDYPSNYTLTMACYNIGNAEQITKVPDVTYPNASAKLINGNVEVLTGDEWMVLGQVRGAGNNSASVPSFIIASYDDEILFNSSDLDLNGSAGGFALSADNKLLYVLDASNSIHVYAIDFAKAETPLTEQYTFKPGNAGTTYQMAFDPAGNLVVAGRDAFEVFTLPREAAETVIAAPVAQVIAGTSGVEDIIVNNEAVTEGAVEYYNLQGVRVAADNLTPGIYIQRTGNTAKKVIIR